jgi:hypothetical protein
MPSGKQRATTEGSQIDAQQANEKAPVAEPSPVFRMLMLATLAHARDVAKASIERWNDLAASGGSDAEELAAAKALAVSSAIAVRKIEQYLSGESREWPARASKLPTVAPMPATKQ